jgi:DNA replication and repair protein RecF
LALALRLAAFEVLHTETAGAAVLILDDVFAELDTSRRSALTGLLGRAEQVLITAAVAADIPAELEAARYTVAEGAVRRDE